jgi:branched-chain amino acid transport system permease protein
MSKYGLMKRISVLTLTIVLLVLPVVVRNDQFLVHVLIMAGVYCILAVSLRFVYLANIWLVGPAAFYAIGAYGVTLLMRAIGLSYWICLPLVGVAVAIIAWVFGYVTIRVRGLYFAILSIAFIEVVRLTFVNTLGSQMLLMVPAPNPITIPHLFTIDFASKMDYYYFMLALFAITLFILFRVERSPVGANFKAITESELLAESLGIKVVRHKVLALCIAAFFIGIAGGFFAPYNQTISPESFTIGASMLVLILMVVGGTGSIWGPVIGATVLTILPEYLPVSPIVENSIYAVFVILILYFLPGGLVSLPNVITGQAWWQKTKEARNNMLARIRRGL